MNKCPECGQPRKADEYRCLACGCFYSQLDELLAAEAEAQYKKSFKGHLQRIWQADDSKQALKAEIHAVPTQTLLTFAVIFIFVFALVVSVL